MALNIIVAMPMPTLEFTTLYSNIYREKQTIEMFERVLQYSNHVGLFSEDIDFTTKRLLGNFPQGYSHIALIDTALPLSNSRESLEETEHFQP